MDQIKWNAPAVPRGPHGTKALCQQPPSSIQSHCFGCFAPYSNDAEPAPAPLRDAREVARRTDIQAPLFEAVNDYVIACGGDPGSYVYGNTRRQRAVVAINDAVTAAINADRARQPDVERLRGLLDEGAAAAEFMLAQADGRDGARESALLGLLAWARQAREALNGR